MGCPRPARAWEGLPFNLKPMDFNEYLYSQERRELYKSHPEKRFVGRTAERLKRVSHADWHNWMEKYAPPGFAEGPGKLI